MFFDLSLFKRFVLRDVRRNWVRTLLTVFGIALGVSVYLAISIANDTALTRFRQTVSQVAGKANLELTPASGPSISEECLRQVAPLAVLGIKYTPIIDEHVVLASASSSSSSSSSFGAVRTSRSDEPSMSMGGAVGEGEVIQLIGIDMLADPDFKRYQSDEDENSNPVASANANKADSSKADTGAISVFSPAAVLVGSKLAGRYGLSKGSELTILASDGREKLKVAGVLSASGLGGAYSGNLIVADIGLAQDLLRWKGQLSRVDIICPKELAAAVEEKLKEVVPADVHIATPDTRSEQAGKMTRSFEYNLLALTFIALMVGMFLIYNTMTITILRRRPEIGILRAIGVSRQTILRLFLWEAFFLGGGGTTIGVIMGGFMADGALKAVAQTFQYFYFKVPLEKVNADPLQYGGAFALGLALTFIAALPPLLEALEVEPAEATRRASHEAKVRKVKGPLFIAGLICLSLCYLSALQGPVFNFPAFGYLAAFLSIIGCSLLMPLLLSKMLPRLAPFLSRAFGVEGRIAAVSLQGTLGRTAVACASLMIGIAMMVSLAIMISSFRKTVTAWIDQSFEADLWLQSQARASGNKYGRLKEEVLPQVASVEGVAAAEGYVDRKIDYQGLQAFLGAADFDVLAEYGNQLFLSGENSKVVCSRVSGMKAIISEPFAVRRSLKKGDSVVLDSPTGKQSFLVEDVFYDYASDLGYVIIPRDTYKSIYGDATISSVAIYLKEGADINAVRQNILKKLHSGNLMALSSTSELRKEAIRIFDRTFAITYALHTIAVTVAILSVMNALFALTIESRREFAILRYLGARKSQLAKIVYLQAGILGACGNLGGIGLGYILSLLLIHVINKQSFGWSVQYSVPLDFIVESSVLVIVTAVASGVIPAAIAAKTLAPAVVRDE
jgi:putative ABC transport system permease protein